MEIVTMGFSVEVEPFVLDVWIWRELELARESLE